MENKRNYKNITEKSANNTLFGIKGRSGFAVATFRVPHTLQPPRFAAVAALRPAHRYRKKSGKKIVKI